MADPVPTARDPRAEAAERAGPGYDVRVLESSPPADTSDPDYLADDPVAPGEQVADRQLLLPVGSGRKTWDTLAAGDTDLASWCADRWLGAWRRLPPSVPDGYHEHRLGLHRLGVYVLSPARMEAIGKMALRYTHRGFGTPFFGVDRQIRVEGLDLVVQDGAAATAEPLSTLAAAADQAGVEVDAGMAERFDVPDAGDVDGDMGIAAPAASFLADWFGFATSVLEEIRGETPELTPSRIQLWPEHFDPAFDQGDEAAGRRAGYGCSPGDHHQGGDPEPYLYLSLWNKDQVPDHEFWNTAFGAKLTYSSLAAADDQRVRALEFFREGRNLLSS